MSHDRATVVLREPNKGEHSCRAIARQNSVERRRSIERRRTTVRQLRRKLQSSSLPQSEARGLWKSEHSVARQSAARHVGYTWLTVGYTLGMTVTWLQLSQHIYITGSWMDISHPRAHQPLQRLKRLYPSHRVSTASLRARLVTNLGRCTSGRCTSGRCTSLQSSPCD